MNEPGHVHNISLFIYTLAYTPDIRHSASASASIRFRFADLTVLNFFLLLHMVFCVFVSFLSILLVGLSLAI